MRKSASWIAILILTAATVAWSAPGGPPERGEMAGGPAGPGDMPGGPPGRGGQRGPGGPPGEGAPPFAKYLFPPEQVLNNQIALGLTEEQVVSVKRLLNETHSRILDFRTDLDRAVERLNTALEPPRVDAEVAVGGAQQGRVPRAGDPDAAGAAV